MNSVIFLLGYSEGKNLHFILGRINHILSLSLGAYTIIFNDLDA